MTSALQKVTVDLGPQSYDIHIGRDLFSGLGKRMPFDLKNRKVFVLTDENVFRKHVMQDQAPASRNRGRFRSGRGRR